MLEDFGYAALFLLVVYALDWSAFARMTNTINIARLSNGRPEAGSSYLPIRRYRILCVISATAMFGLGEVVAAPFHQMLYATAAIAAAVMIFITVGQPEP